MPNPYLNRVAIRDPAQFYGRRREVARIFSRLGADRPQSMPCRRAANRQIVAVELFVRPRGAAPVLGPTRRVRVRVYGPAAAPAYGA